MNNIGYKLGKLVVSYKKWEHPLLLKIIYGLMILMLLAIIVGIIVTIVVGIAAILCSIVASDNICSSLNNTDDEEIYTGDGPSGYGTYVDGCRID